MSNLNQDIDNIVSILAPKYNLTESTFLSLFIREMFCMDNSAEKPFDEDILLMLVIVLQKNLNPFAKEVYAVKSEIGDGFEAVLALNGWLRIMNNHPCFSGISVVFSEQIEVVKDGIPCPSWAECSIYRKDRQTPIVVREYFEEVYIAPRYDEQSKKEINSYWQTHPKRMLRHRVIEQCARVAFGFDKVHEPIQDYDYTFIKNDINNQKNGNDHNSESLSEEPSEDNITSKEDIVSFEDKDTKIDENQVKISSDFQNEIENTVHKAVSLAKNFKNDFSAVQGFLTDKYSEQPEALAFALEYANSIKDQLD